MAAIAIIVVCAFIGWGSYMITKTPDSPVEQVAEEVIDMELGVPPGTIDLTPERKEK